MSYQIVPASPLHVGPIAARMGHEASLIEAAGGHPRRWLRWHIEESIDARVAILNGEPVAIWGTIGSLLETEVEIWAVYTEQAKRRPLAIVREARAYLQDVLQTRVAVVSLIRGGDLTARRFAEFLGFDVAVHGPVLDEGVVCYPIRLIRDAPKPYRPPFIVYGLPRSRTAWLSRFLTHAGWTCHHEAAAMMSDFDDVAKMFRRPMTGSAETAASFGWQLLEHHFPDMRRVVVRRPLEECVASMVRVDVAGVAEYPEDDVRRVMRYGARMLDQISARPDVLTVNFNDLDEWNVCASIYAHCLGRPMPDDWWNEMRARNIQSDPKAAILHRLANREVMGGFKRACWLELMRLRRSGLILKEAA